MLSMNADRLGISPRKQLWIKAVKKLTSERLGREALAAWEDPKSAITGDDEESTDKTSQTEDDNQSKTDEAQRSESNLAQIQSVKDEESQAERGF